MPTFPSYYRPARQAGKEWDIELMQQNSAKNTPGAMVVLAFLAVYIVWGSTYYFIQRALTGFPPQFLGALRFLAAGLLLLAWCAWKGEQILKRKDVINAGIAGVLMLFIGNGIVIWVEQTLPSAMAAIIVSSTPLWFVLLDKQKWKVNLRSRTTVLGLLIGFAGVLLLFSKPVIEAYSSGRSSAKVSSMLLLTIGVLGWTAGSLFTKHRSSAVSTGVNTSWQMISAGIAFIPGVLYRDELHDFHFSDVSAEAWFSIFYLMIMGSIVAYSAYVWLLQVRPATQVSTYAYVNPVVAVVIGVLFAGEQVDWMQILGLGIILGSVLLINLSNYYSPTKKTI